MPQLDAGVYSGFLTDWGTTQSKKGTPQIRLVFAIGQTERSVFIALTDAAWPTSQQKLQTLGFNGDFGEGMGFEKRENIELICSHEEYNGQNVERWELKNWGTERKPIQKATGQIVAQLNAKWKAKVGAVAGKTPSPPAPSKPAAAPAKKGPPPIPPVKKAGPTREDAWVAFSAASTDDKSAADMWPNMLLELFGAGFDEEKATAADWQRVITEGPAKAIPF